MTTDDAPHLAISLERFYEIVKQTGNAPSPAELAAASARVAHYYSKPRHGGDSQWMADHLGMTIEDLAKRFDELCPYEDWREA